MYFKGFPHVCIVYLSKITSETVTVTAGGEGTSGERWGCTLKSDVVYTDPPTQDPESKFKFYFHFRFQ